MSRVTVRIEPCEQMSMRERKLVIEVYVVAEEYVLIAELLVWRIEMVE